MNEEPETGGINQYSESALHLALKHWLMQPGDRLEVMVDGSVIDLVRGDMLFEVQTRGFSALKRKLPRLLESHPVRVVYPVPQARWIVKLAADGTAASRRKSPKRGDVTQVFSELVYLGDLLARPNLSLMVLMVHDEEIRRDDGKGSWRRKGWSIGDRRLLDVKATYLFTFPADYLALLPDELPGTFTTAQLAQALGQRRRTAQQMAYVLRVNGWIYPVGKQGNAICYAISSCS